MSEDSPNLSQATLAYGLRAAQSILGLDALYRSESGDGTGLAVLDMSEPGELEADVFADYAAADHAFRGLRADSDELVEPDRQRYYDQLCHSSLAFIRWRDRGLPFKEQLAGFLHVPAEPASGESIDALCAELAQRLKAMGFNGGLAEQCATWEEKNRVPAT